MKRTLVAVALAVVFVMALAAPAFAQMTHSVSYEMDGVIDLEKQAGHKCNTGAAVLQTIKGSGVMDKTQTISMGWGKIVMDDENNWVAGATPLTVTTVWDLCAPAKYVYETIGSTDPVAGLDLIYTPSGYEHPNDKMAAYGYTALTDQIWAVQVQADPGFSGNLTQNGEAAYGSWYLGEHDETFASWTGSESGWDYNGLSYAWGRFVDLQGNRVTEIGPNYVGNYFNMEQHARTSQGTVRRYIDISSPHNHGYLMEDMSVVGKSDIKDAFSNVNVKPGTEVPGTWWKLF